MATRTTAVGTVVAHGAARMPALGFGTWQAKPGEVSAAVRIAIQSGFRLIDCARIYRNEAEIGAAIAAAIDAGDIKDRQELFVVSKLWNTDHEPNRVEEAVRRSLADLKLSQLDLYLIHWPVAWRHPTPIGATAYDNVSDYFPRNAAGGCDEAPGVTLEHTWAAMEALVDLGLVKHIGLSNCNAEQTQRIWDFARIKPVANQVECHVALPQVALRALHEKLGMVTMAYCPLGIGMDGPEAAAVGLINAPEIVQLAKSCLGADVTAADFLLRWNLLCGNVVLTKSVKPDRIRQAAALPGPCHDHQAFTDHLREVTAVGQLLARRVCNPTFFHVTAGPLFPLLD